MSDIFLGTEDTAGNEIDNYLCLPFWVSETVHIVLPTTAFTQTIIYILCNVAH